MKLKNIFLSGLSVLALASCSDYLDVEAPSKNELDYVYSDKAEIQRALNGVYAAMLSNNTYGQNFLSTFQLNSDVDFGTSTTPYATSTNYKRFDCDADGSHLLSAWTAQYNGIERANLFIEQLENSPLFDDKEYSEELHSMLGEAKVLRAIFYHDLTWMFGDVPFTFQSSNTRESSVIPIVDRTEMLQTLIDDLIGCAEEIRHVGTDGLTVERITRDMAHAMIARLALTAGGYSLRPEGGVYGTMKRPENYTVNGKTYNYTDFYKIAMEYAGKVIENGNHHLTMPYHQVFVNECNFSIENNDDVIFEIPFGSESTGRIGYIHGPRMQDLNNETAHNYGKASGSAKLNPLYRFLFEEGDVRREYINQLFNYNTTGEARLEDSPKTTYNGKWSKLWNAGGMGPTSTEETGINYPLMRYTDVLLMFAEAVNEIENGFGGDHGSLANQAYQEVRTRAFPDHAEKVGSLMGKSKEEILKAILDERKFEFAGENMRWRDLVRNNLYNQQIYYTYWRLFLRGADRDDSDTEAVSQYDFGEPGRWSFNVLPTTIYRVENADNTGKGSLPDWAFPNRNVKVVKMLNPYFNVRTSDLPNYLTEEERKDFKGVTIYDKWKNTDTGNPADDFLYSLYGYIYYDEDEDQTKINNNGVYEDALDPSTNPNLESLPVVRYILPIPRTVISRVFGAYENKYGYR